MAELNYYVTSVGTPSVADGSYGAYGGKITIAPSGSYGASDNEDFQLQTEYVLWIHARAGYTVSATNFSYQGATPYGYGSPNQPDFILYQEWSGDAPSDAIVPVFPEVNGATAIKSVSFEDIPFLSFEEQMEWELSQQGITEDDELFDLYMESAVTADEYIFQDNPGVGNKVKVVVTLHEGWQMPAEDAIINVDIDGFAEVYVEESDIDLDLEAEDPDGPGDPIDPEWDWDDYDIDLDNDEDDLIADVDITYADNDDEDDQEDGDDLNDNGDGDDLGDEPDGDSSGGVDLLGSDTQIALDESALNTDTVSYTDVESSTQGVFAHFSFQSSQEEQTAPGIKHKFIFDGISREVGDVVTVVYSMHLRSTEGFDDLYINSWPGSTTKVTTIIGGVDHDDTIVQGESVVITREYTATENDYDEKIHIKFKGEDQKPLAGAEFLIWNMSVLVKDQYNNTKKYYVADFTQLHNSSGELVEDLSWSTSLGQLAPTVVSGPNGTNPHVDNWRAGGINGMLSYKVYNSETTDDDDYFIVD